MTAAKEIRVTIEQSSAETTPEPHSLHLGRAALNFLRDLVLAVVIGVGLFLAVRATLQHVLVEGPSMEPNFYNGQRVWVNTLAYRLGQPQRGDVVVFHFKFRQDQEPFIKRIVGLPGEEVEVREGVVYVNGQRLDEPWATRPAQYTKEKLKLGPDEFYVLGDNRVNSSDSHVWGAQPADLIIGKVWITIWPPQDWPLVGRLFGRTQRGV